ncbi:hypothetical protein E4T56_gene8804 [Termitomyces sp. T112]|nr:hypothetical protein E4T56_gene8804 [Termitomyces sp. T112]
MLLYPAVILYIALLTGQVVAITCAVCPSSIVYAGLTRRLTLTRYSSSLGTVQCNFDSPPISGFSPYCIYRNVDGSLYFTNTGGACPASTTLVTETTSLCDCQASSPSPVESFVYIQIYPDSHH